ncbi:hypothetical protein A0U40_07740 [[Bacillus] sp. KCTC 13219]|nr:hypothetical protein A0U40_07740 [[Bacillus] sp. KCTC 13219]
MPSNGDTYTVEIKNAHLNWGVYRHTHTRGTVYGEGYIQIPSYIAESFNIFNRNHRTANAVYTCSSADGFLQNASLLASGNSVARGVYAKQFQGNGSLQTIGAWYHHVGAQVGDFVKVTFTGPNSMIIEHIPNPQLSMI